MPSAIVVTGTRLARSRSAQPGKTRPAVGRRGGRTGRAPGARSSAHAVASRSSWSSLKTVALGRRRKVDGGAVPAQQVERVGGLWCQRQVLVHSARARLRETCMLKLQCVRYPYIY